ncbi:MAG: hypothetical protein U5P41_12860 [Gammaproteobacteria bacterium]|nr:hypothetical protein [Gammaproteobacteria bacterium]
MLNTNPRIGTLITQYLNINVYTLYIAILYFLLIFTPSLCLSHGSINPPSIDQSQLRVVKEASSDIYTPPTDGKLTENQIIDFIELSQNAIDKYEDMIDKANHVNTHTNSESQSNCNYYQYKLATITSVKSNDYNWAEHDWITRQLIQTMHLYKLDTKSLDSAAAHNVNLFKKLKSQLLPIINYC